MLRSRGYYWGSNGAPFLVYPFFIYFNLKLIKK